jgi:hypothetical protein
VTVTLRVSGKNGEESAERGFDGKVDDINGPGLLLASVPIGGLSAVSNVHLDV